MGAAASPLIVLIWSSIMIPASSAGEFFPHRHHRIFASAISCELYADGRIAIGVRFEVRISFEKNPVVLEIERYFKLAQDFGTQNSSKLFS